MPVSKEVSVPRPKANDSRDELIQLFERNGIDIKRGPIFDEAPALPEGGIPFDRFEGMMLGLAVGDALGNTSESIAPAERRLAHGEIRDYLPNRRAGGRRVGLPSDDTQLAFWTLDQMLDDGGKLVPGNIARRFLSSGRIFGMGATMRQFLANYRQVTSWSAAGGKSAGNGAIMRIAPVVYSHLANPSELLWSDAAILAMITHNDSAAIASCVGFTA
ncbi:MAG TPA: ADP-ribosylglycohydrolase family protein, partial [Candidatus Deferrimicrobiaceae bacterium]